MAATGISKTNVAWLAALCLYVTLPARVHAQAWVPAKGDGVASFTYQNLQAGYHLNYLGQRVNPGQIRTHTAVMGFEYGITDKLALNADVAYVASRYKGDRPENTIDDGFF